MDDAGDGGGGGGDGVVEHLPNGQPAQIGISPHLWPKECSLLLLCFNSLFLFAAFHVKYKQISIFS